MRRIEELREGAFSPFSQQPVVRAMLLPLGGFGGTALLSYLHGDLASADVARARLTALPRPRQNAG